MSSGSSPKGPSYSRSRYRDSDYSTSSRRRSTSPRSRRESDRGREREHNRHRDYRDSYHRSRYRSPSRSPSPGDRDERTVFVQQLSARLRTKELVRFFEKAGEVSDASIVKDKISGRSKGVAYVEFRDVKSVEKAIEMTGEKLLGIPVIVQATEAEKNRLSTTDKNVISSDVKKEGPVECRVYAGNINFGIDEKDLVQVFRPFGEIESVNLQRNPDGQSKGYAFIQ